MQTHSPFLMNSVNLRIFTLSGMRPCLSFRGNEVTEESERIAVVPKLHYQVIGKYDSPNKMSGKGWGFLDKLGMTVGGGE
ncbi:MAG: hypothetical protein ACI4HZ_10415 [Ruminococcus sp.]